MIAMMRIAPLLLISFLLAGCDVVKDRMGVKDPAKLEAEAKAVGASCRLSGRSLEDCYTLNDSSPRAPIYAGWKEMNEYMAERKMEVQPPRLGPDGKPVARAEVAQASKEPSKEAKAEMATEAVKNGTGKEAVKDIRPKKPDLAKEVAKH